MKKLYLLTLLIFAATSLFAKPDLSKSERFQLACIMYSQGCIVEGSYVGQNTPMHHLLQPSTDEAAYWIIAEESNGLYSIRNAASGRYVTYDGAYVGSTQNDPVLRRYVSMTDQMDGRNSLWTFNHEGGNTYSIRNAEHNDHLWDVRASSYCVGTYSRMEAPNSNQQFNIVNADGTLVAEEEVKPVETPGYNVSSWLRADASSLNNWNAEGSWTVNTGAGGSHYGDNASLVAPFIENWHQSNSGPLADCTLMQTLEHLPAGQYFLEADMMAVRQQYDDWWTGEHYNNEPATGVTLFANNDAISIATGNDPPQHFVLPFTLSSKGDVTIGISVRNTNANWVAVDNLMLHADVTLEELIEAEKDMVREVLDKKYAKEEAEAMIEGCGDDFNKLEELRKRIEMLPDADPLGEFVSNLTIDGYSLAYSATPDIYLCTVPLEWFGATHTAVINFTPHDGCTLKIGNKTVKPGDQHTYTNISAGAKYTFTVTGTNGNSVSKDITFTSLPVVRIYGSFNNDYSEGFIAVNEADANLPELTSMKAKWRGGITNSSGKNKRNYHVKLKDENGEKLEKRFFGLRKDNSWILESCQVDMSRIRNRILTDLWNDYCSEPYYIKQEKKALSGTNGRFVELILNDEYRGIYCMTENMDRKQMKLKKIDEETQTVHGQLWKSKDWTYATMMGTSPDGSYQPKDYLTNPNAHSEMWDSYEVKYPDFDDYGNQTDWETLYNAVDFVCHSSDETFREQFSEYFDLPVVIDYYILMETILSTDNHGKNMFFAVYDKQVDKKITLAVWDMDATCGQRWSDQYYHQAFLGPEQDYAQFISRYEHGDYNLFKRLRDTDTEDFNMKVRLRYRDLRQDQLATAKILNRFRTQLDEFKKCGAAQREYDKWSYDSDVAGLELNFDVEMDYLTDWFTRRMDYLDQVRFNIDELPNIITDINRMNNAKANNIIYDIKGQKVATMDEYNRLPAGIYIINGKKSVKK